MRLSDVVAALRRFWILALATFLVVFLIGALAAFVPTPKYRASATLIVTPKVISFATISAVNFLLPSVVEQVKTREFHQRVDRRLAPWVRATKPSLDASFEPGTAIMHVSALSHSPVAAAAAANAAARETVAHPISRAATMALLAPAPVPRSRKVPIMAGATLLGLILALFAVAGANAARRRVQSTEEIQDQFGVEVLTEIPARRRLPSATATVFTDESYADVDEAFQRLRTNLEFAAEGDLVVAVTSSAPGEGKSTVTASLAWTLANVGHEVVAVDADLRRPTLHRYFGGSLEGGLADLDDPSADVEMLLQSTDVPNLSLLSAGRLDAHPTQIVHRLLPRVLTEIDGRVVVIDTPPVLGVSEAALVAGLAGNALLVIDSRRRDPAELARVLRDLRRSETRVLGAAVNRARTRHQRYSQAYVTPSPARIRRRSRL
jgi:capsular exopolysaccharide synthesis family protein